jgi:hypothetical protein
MTFLEELTAHKGGLILLKSELFWYGGGGWDSTPGRVCLLMDSATADVVPGAVCHATARLARLEPGRRARRALTDAATLLLIDGRPHWVWVGADDLELLSSFEPEEQ